MFFIKHHGQKLNIAEQNVYSYCPRCGKAHAVELMDFIHDPDFDLYTTAVYCAECTAQI